MKKLITTIRIIALLAFCINANAQTNGWVYPEFPVTLSPEFPKVCTAMNLHSNVTCIEDYDSYVWVHENGIIKEGKSVIINISGTWELSVSGLLNNQLCSSTFQFEVLDLSNEDGTGCNDCVPFSPCDDRDDCTINDQYDENCLCKGTADFDFEIVRNTPISCENGPVELTVDQEFEYYEWSIDGIFQSNSKTYTAVLPGNYLVEVKNEEGCLLGKTIEILDYSGNNIEIITSQEFLCNSSESIELRVLDQLENIVWRNEDGVQLQGSDPIVSVNKVGIYTITATDENQCERNGEVEIKSKYPDAKIFPENPILCDGESVQLRLQNIPDDVSIVWSYENDVLPESGESIIAQLSGIYSATIEDEDECVKQIEVNVIENNEASIGSVLEQNGFIELDVEIISVSLVEESPFQQIVTNNDCVFNSENTLNSYLVRIEGVQGPVVLSDYLAEIYGESCTCNSDMAGLLLDNFCANENYTLDDFVNFDNTQDGVLQSYIHHDGQGSFLYLKNTLKDPGCVYDPNILDTDGFFTVLNSIICSTLEGENLELNYLPIVRGVHPDLVKKRRADIFAGRFKHFDGNLYDNVIFDYCGAIISNYQYGKQILTSSIEFYDFDDDASDENLCYQALTISPQDVSDNYYQVKFQYLPIDDNCNNYLTITLDYNQGKNFAETLKNITSEVNDLVAYSGNDRIERLESVPNCYLDHYHKCTILRDEVPTSGSKRLFYNLTDLNTLNPIDNPYDVITCFDENELVDDYSANLFEDRGERIGFLERLVEIYYKGQTNWSFQKDKETFRLQGGDAIMGYGNNISQDYFNDWLSVRYDQQGLLGSEFIQNKTFKYFDKYEVKLAPDYDYLGLPSGEEIKESVNHIVPGIYVAYAVEKKIKSNNEQDLRLALNTLSVVAGFGQLSFALQASFRLAAFSTVMGGLEVGVGLAHVVLENTAICEGLDMVEFCKTYQPILPYLDIILISGGFAAIKLDDLIAAKIQWSKIVQGEQDLLLNRIASSTARTQFDEVFTINYDLVNELRIRFPNIHNRGVANGVENIFESLVAGNISANKLLDLSDAIHLLDEGTDLGINGYKFVDDILNSSTDLSKIGHPSNLLNMTETQVKAWDKVKHSLDAGISAKATDVPFLQKFDDIVQNNNLGLDADGLQAVLNAAAVKGQKWDFPENILDAVKRASDGNISGMVVAHKKFPTPSNGNSSYVLEQAKLYQQGPGFDNAGNVVKGSGDANLSFEVGGRSFDNVAPDGKLIDRKYGHGNSIFDRVEGEFGEVVLEASNPTRIRSLLRQAKGQISAANGHPIRWEIQSSTGADGIGQLFNGQLGDFLNEAEFVGIDFSVIEVVHVSF